MKLSFWVVAVLLIAAAAVMAQDYVGDQECMVCHSGIYNDYMDSGHPYKITHTGGETPAEDTWPWTPVPPLPMVEGQQLTWEDVEYVIGNFYWKARFIDREGYIYTGGEDDATQWNLWYEDWVPYHAGDVDKPFNCGRCHTTGYDGTEGTHQLDLPGLIGTWAQDGIRCEACHGPGSDHIANPDVHPENGKDCSECHYRDSEFRMPWSGGFTKHHQQAEDLSHSPHAMFDCTTCHDPHLSTVYDQGGIPDDFSCSNCHPGNEENSYYVLDEMESLECMDCHMPMMGKSAQADPENEYKGDIHGHLFRIMTDPIAREDNTVEIDGSLYWAQDDDGNAYATLDYVCFACHTDMTLQDAADYAEDIHELHAAAVDENAAATMPDKYRIAAVYPNPFNPSTTIRIDLDRPTIAKLSVYDALGREVAVLRDGPAQEGSYEIQFDGSEFSSGIYFARLETKRGSSMKKMVLMK